MLLKFDCGLNLCCETTRLLKHEEKLKAASDKLDKFFERD